MLYVLIPLYVIVCLFLILVVLLQQGKGADVASAFGASSSQTTFGARGATTVFERITTWAFVAFSVLAITISIVQSRPRGLDLSRHTGKPAASVPKPAALPAAPASAPAVPPASAPVSAAPAPAAPATK
ncbi:MAG TPA: preprotein translocase subunit SecG [Thermoanaerobaculia bacterium]|nr:preprotein translocase subunit SecG [Thermoanaerobaculia bacterium]